MSRVPPESQGSRWTALGRAIAAPGVALIATAAVLTIAETLRAFVRIEPLPISGIPRPLLPFAVFVAIAGLLLAHGVPLWFLGRAISARYRVAYACAVGLVFGYGWHLTLVQGDGLRASGAYWFARIGFAVAIPAGIAAFVYLLADARMPPQRRQRLLVAAAGIGAALNFFVWPSYRAFHGYLAAFVAACLFFVLLPLAHHRALRRATVGVLVLSVALLPFFPRRRLVEGNVRRLTRAGGPMLSVLPLSAPLLLKAVPLVDPYARVPPEDGARFDAEQDRRRRFARGVGPARGRNVLFIVLETTRWDAWRSPELTPRFHQWRSRGLYVPAAVAQYPATPLAYGALFAAQPASVLAQVPYWGSRRLLGMVSSRFERRLYTRPDIPWFDHAAITSFFLPPGDLVHKHASSESGLAHIRGELERNPDGSFFALAHLYEPHDPWEEHPGFSFGSDITGRYRSEIAFLDAQLGAFMQWFFAQPFADDTLVLVIGDHGEGLGERINGEPFYGHHVQVSGVVARVPFFAAGPGVPRNVVREDLPVAQMDMMPTVFDFLGASLPEPLLLQGRSLWALLDDPSPRDLPTEAFSIRGPEFFDLVTRATNLDSPRTREKFRRLNEEGTYAPKLSLQHGRWKITWDTVLDRFWIHDVVSDPYERVDLAAARPDVLKAMRARLRTWRREQTWRIKKLERLDGTTVDRSGVTAEIAAPDPLEERP